MNADQIPKMTTEVLVDCPECGRQNFTTKGLKAHRCRPAAPASPPVTPEANAPALPKALASLPVEVAGSWDAARLWRDAAVAMERGKLFCQVMLGLELIALKEVFGISQGKRTDLSQNETSWSADLVEKELGISRATAFRIMAMADAARLRLKKLPALQGVDQGEFSLFSLNSAQRASLETAVHKLTDGRTQAEFCQDLGIAKLPAGAKSAGRKPGEGGSRRLSEEEKLKTAQEHAVGDWQFLERSLLMGYKTLFCLLPDPQVEAQIDALQKALDARKVWLATPAALRNQEAVDALIDDPS